MTKPKDEDNNILDNNEDDATFGFIMDKAMQYSKEIDQGLSFRPSHMHTT